MSNTATVSSAPRTNWSQVYSLLALNAAIVISWIAYHNYQPKVLEIFHFTELKLFLIVAQGLILVLIPPVAGVVGDFMIRKNGNSLVVFTVGVSVTAMVFMLVAFTVGAQSTIDLTAALPIMIVVWLISMNVFHSPANSMLEMFAPAKDLPAAMALIVLTTELLSAFEPLIIEFVNAIGPVATFALGGFLIIVTGYFFRRTTRNVKFERDAEEATSKENEYFKVLFAGLAIGLATALIKNYMADWMLAKSDFPLFKDASILVAGVLVISAIAAVPLVRYINRLGVFTSLVYGLVVTFAALALIYFIPSGIAAVVLGVVVGLSFSFASVAGFPYALSHLSPRHVTLGAGVFFGSVEVADSIINYLQA
ncbi:MAG: MFS transporter [Cyclobacteriaceae bacterium]